MMTKYNELVDHLVSTMPPSIHDQMYNKQQQSEQPFDTQAYANYKALVDKEKEQIDLNNLTESLYKLGYKIDTLLTKLISQLDVILEDKSIDSTWLHKRTKKGLD